MSATTPITVNQGVPESPAPSLSLLPTGSRPDHKRRAMRAHASQISEQSFFLAMDDDRFHMAFGIEWFIRAGQGPGFTETDLMAGL